MKFSIEHNDISSNMTPECKNRCQYAIKLPAYAKADKYVQNYFPFKRMIKVLAASAHIARGVALAL